MSLLNNAVWVISNLCRGKPGPNSSIVEPIIKPLVDLLSMEVPVEIKVDAVWALAYISDGNNERIQMAMDTDVTSKLVEFLAVPSSNLLTPTVRCLGNFVSGSDHQTQAVLNAGLLQHLNALLDNPRVSFSLCNNSLLGLLSHRSVTHRDPLYFLSLIECHPKGSLLARIERRGWYDSAN
jgi:importin subunit alpha-6/7